MSEGHERFQQLAVGHVLGGLADDDASSFRAHLVGCRDCRKRVAELRGIASDLEAAERDERARALVTTELEGAPEGPDGAEGPTSAPRIGVRHVTVAAVVVMVFAAAMAFWNLHLRTTNDAATGVAERQTDVLDVLATGVEVEIEAEEPLQGLAAVAEDRLALTLSGLPALADDERLVVWRLVDGEPVPVRSVSARELGEGPAALVVDLEGARAVEVSLERGRLGQRPTTRLARADLDDA